MRRFIQRGHPFEFFVNRTKLTIFTMYIDISINITVIPSSTLILGIYFSPGIL